MYEEILPHEEDWETEPTDETPGYEPFADNEINRVLGDPVEIASPRPPCDRHKNCNDEPLGRPSPGRCRHGNRVGSAPGGEHICGECEGD